MKLFPSSVAKQKYKTRIRQTSKETEESSGCLAAPGPSGSPDLGELVGDLWGVGILSGLLLQRHHYEILEKLSLLPLDQLQLQSAITGGLSQHGLQF